MQVEVFKSAQDGLTFHYQIYSLMDIFNMKLFPTYRFVSFKTILNHKVENTACNKAKKIFIDFLDLMSNDLIEKNDTFIFPKKGFGIMKVMNTADKNHPGYFYNIDTEGKIYSIQISSYQLRTKTKKYFWCSLEKPKRIKMMRLIKSGHKY